MWLENDHMPSHNRVVGLVLSAFLLGCTDATGPGTLLRPPSRPASLSVTPTLAMVTGARVRFTADDADSVRVHYVAADGPDAGATRWVSVSRSAVLVLGLESATRYLMWTEAKRGSATAIGDTLSFVTEALPPALAEARLERQRGGPLSGGYTLTSTMGADRHFYAVAFDSVGVVRWYRDLGFPGAVADVQQQHNGHITAGVGPSHGYDSAAVHFVEFTHAGDSVRAIVATGSAFTDAHELIVDTEHGSRIADYLFGYDIRAADLTEFGGGPTDPLAGHQVLRISAAGGVDTLVQGWDHWSERDAVIGPTLAGDFDHPNSLSFDLDGGLVISYRALGSVVKLAPDSRTVAWVFGGTGNQFTITGDPLDGFGGQHTVRVLPDGHLLMFDNGWNHTPQRSRAVEYALDPGTREARMVWQYAPEPAVFVPFTGSAQRLANGNTVVTFTGAGFLDEVSPDGVLLSRMALRSGSESYTPYRTQRIRSLYRYERP
jgi:hypothetical protein